MLAVKINLSEVLRVNSQFSNYRVNVGACL